MKLNNSNMSDETGKTCFMNGLKLNKASVIFCLCALVLQVGTPYAHAATIETNTVTLTVAADVHIRITYANQDGVNPMIVGQFSNGSHSRLLLRFDTSSISAQSGAINVTEVQLVGRNDPSTAGSGTSTFNAHDYGYEFVENVATWTNPAGNGDDLTDGGTVGTLVASAASASSVANAWVTFASNSAFTNVVMTALASDNTVNLLVKRSSESASNVFNRMQDENSADPFKLTVTYERTIPPAGTVLVIQ